MAIILGIGEYNQDLIKRKLSLYKQLLRNPDEQSFRESLDIIKEQDEYLRRIQDLIIDLENMRGVNMTEHVKLAYSFLERGKSMLNRLLQSFFSQRSALEDKHKSMKDNIGLYITYFKKELGVYKEYESLSKEFPPELTREVKK